MGELEVKREGFLPRISLEDIRELKSQYDLFRKLQRDVLEEGIDYGFPAGRRSPEQKPSLYKSGAEKLLRLFNLSPSFEIISEKETDDFIMYKFKCILRSATGRPIGEGYGACNSREKQGWNANPWAFQNNILKMAKKRSLVDAVLTGLGASNVFTQDLEDMEEIPEENGNSSPKQNDFASKKQIEYLNGLLERLAKKQNTTKERLLEFIYKAERITELSQLSKQKASELIERVSRKLKLEGEKEEEKEVLDEGEVIDEGDDLSEISEKFSEE